MLGPEAGTIPPPTGTTGDSRTRTERFVATTTAGGSPTVNTPAVVVMTY